MDEHNDKSKTVEFKPVREEEAYTEKQPVSRTESDRYSEARRTSVPSDEEYDNYENDGEEEQSSKKLVWIAASLAAALIVIIVAGIIIINNGGIGKKPENSTDITDSLDKNTVEDDNSEKNDNNVVSDKNDSAEKKEKTAKCSVVFYGDSVVNRGDYYYIKADLYDNSFKKTESRKILINSSSVIKENGKRITADALAYIVEQFSGEMIIFDGEIREDDGFAVSLSFSGSFKEEMKDGETVPAEDESPDKNDDETNTPEPSGSDNGSVDLPEENENDSDNILNQTQNQ